MWLHSWKSIINTAFFEMRAPLWMNRPISSKLNETIFTTMWNFSFPFIDEKLQNACSFFSTWSSGTGNKLRQMTTYTILNPKVSLCNKSRTNFRSLIRTWVKLRSIDLNSKTLYFRETLQPPSWGRLLLKHAQQFMVCSSTPTFGSRQIFERRN